MQISIQCPDSMTIVSSHSHLCHEVLQYPAATLTGPHEVCVLFTDDTIETILHVGHTHLDKKDTYLQITAYWIQFSIQHIHSLAGP